MEILDSLLGLIVKIWPEKTVLQKEIIKLACVVLKCSSYGVGVVVMNNSTNAALDGEIWIYSKQQIRLKAEFVGIIKAISKILISSNSNSYSCTSDIE